MTTFSIQYQLYCDDLWRVDTAAPLWRAWNEQWRTPSGYKGNGPMRQQPPGTIIWISESKHYTFSSKHWLVKDSCWPYRLGWNWTPGPVLSSAMWLDCPSLQLVMHDTCPVWVSLIRFLSRCLLWDLGRVVLLQPLLTDAGVGVLVTRGRQWQQWYTVTSAVFIIDWPWVTFTRILYYAMKAMKVFWSGGSRVYNGKKNSFLLKPLNIHADLI